MELTEDEVETLGDATISASEKMLFFAGVVVPYQEMKGTGSRNQGLGEMRSAIGMTPLQVAGNVATEELRYMPETRAVLLDKHAPAQGL